MISDKQLEANKRNAQKSTGPKSVIGKSIASKNAITHGLRSVQPVIDGEDPAEYNDFRNDMIIQFAPIGPMEYLLVDRIVHSAWRLRRIGRIEIEVFDFLRHPVDKKLNKSETTLKVERSEIRQRRIRSSHYLQEYQNMANTTTKHNRFASFDEAKAAWSQTEDGVLYKQNKCPSDPDYPTPSESFSNFIKPPKQPEPSDDPKILLSAIDRYRSKPVSREDHARRDKLAETQMDTDPADPPLTLGQAFVDDLQGNGLLTRLSRYESNIERSMFKNLRQLQCLQSQRVT